MRRRDLIRAWLATPLAGWIRPWVTRAAAIATETGRDADATGPAFAELAGRLDLPRQGHRALLDHFVRRRRATDPIVTSLVEDFIGVRPMVDRMRAMSRAGIALVRGGEPMFNTIDDPFGEGPHGLERRGGGSLIRSALVDPGRSGVTLAIGEAS